MPEHREVLVRPRRVHLPEAPVGRLGPAEVDGGSPGRDRVAAGPRQLPPDQRRRDGEAEPRARNGHRRRVGRVGGEADDAVEVARRERAAAAPARLDAVHDRHRAVAIRLEMTRVEWVVDPVAVELRQVDVEPAGQNVADHRSVRDDVLLRRDRGTDVEVLESAAVRGDDDHLVAVADTRSSGDHRVDSRTRRRVDVDAVVERERARRERRVPAESAAADDRARIAEIAADRVLPVEGLDRPAVDERSAVRAVARASWAPVDQVRVACAARAAPGIAAADEEECEGRAHGPYV